MGEDNNYYYHVNAKCDGWSFRYFIIKNYLMLKTHPDFVQNVASLNYHGYAFITIYSSVTSPNII